MDARWNTDGSQIRDAAGNWIADAATPQDADDLVSRHNLDVKLAVGQETARMKADVMRLEAERDKARDAVSVFGEHLHGCSYWLVSAKVPSCSCGLDAARKAGEEDG